MGSQHVLAVRAEQLRQAWWQGCSSELCKVTSVLLSEQTRLCATPWHANMLADQLGELLRSDQLQVHNTLSAYAICTSETFASVTAQVVILSF